jgi:hypothetical protein
MSSHNTPKAETTINIAAENDLLAELTSAAELWLETIVSAVSAVRDPAPILAALETIERTVSQARARSAPLISALKQNGMPRSLGANGAADLLRDRLRIRPADARSRVRVAVAFADNETAGLRTTAEALRRGQITHEHAVVIERAVRRMPKSASERQKTNFEIELNDLARDRDPRACEEQAGKKLSVMDPEKARNKRGEKRILILRRRADGMTELRAVLDSAGDAALRAALDPLSGPRRSATGESTDPRPLAQRRGEALVRACEQALVEMRRSPDHRGDRLRNRPSGRVRAQRMPATGASGAVHPARRARAQARIKGEAPGRLIRNDR